MASVNHYQNLCQISLPHIANLILALSSVVQRPTAWQQTLMAIIYGWLTRSSQSKHLTIITYTLCHKQNFILAPSAPITTSFFPIYSILMLSLAYDL